MRHAQTTKYTRQMGAVSFVVIQDEGPGKGGTSIYGVDRDALSGRLPLAELIGML